MSMKTKLFAAAAAAALLSAVSVGTASADQYSNDSTPGFTINAGVGPRFDTAVATGTVYPTVGNFNDVTMNGTPQLTSAAIDPFTIIDDSGAGAGWHVTLLVPDFTDGRRRPTWSTPPGAQMNAAVVTAGNTDSAMGGVWADPIVDFTAAKTIITADPGRRHPQRWCPARSRRRDQRGRHGHLPRVAPDPEAGRPGQLDRRCVHDDCDHCHRGRAVIAD